MSRTLLTLALAVVVGHAQTAAAHNQQSAQTPREPPPPSSIHLMGRVVLADGTAPPERLEVTLICDGRDLRRSMTDGEGRFSIEVSNRPTGASTSGESAGPVGATAPWPGPPVGPTGTTAVNTGIFPTVGAGRVDMTSCQLRADAIEGHRPGSLPLGIRHAMRSPDVGVIVLPSATSAPAEPTISVNSLAASDRARSAVERARRHLAAEEPEFDKARKALQEAVEDSPEFALAWGMLAQVRLREDEPDEARAAFEKALAADQNYDLPYLELARLDARARQWDECARRTARLIELNPNVAEAYYLDGAAHYHLGTSDRALASFEALQLRPAAVNFPRGFFMHGMILARRDRLPEAARQFEAFLKAAVGDESLKDISAQVDAQLNTWAGAGLIVREP